jgi:hypothetical protein
MARGTQLSALVDALRAEIGASTNVGMGVNTLPVLKQILNRTQERLWNDFDWPFAFIERDEDLLNGERYYGFDNDIDFNRITCAHVRYSDTWRPMEYGIGVEQYNSSDPTEGEKEDPPTRWRHHEGNQFEVWPMPASDECTLRFKAIRRLPKMLADSDVALLDDNLIVLFAASELLAKAKSADAGAKLQAAQALYVKLKGQGIKTDMFPLGGGMPSYEGKGMNGARILPSDRV